MDPYYRFRSVRYFGALDALRCLAIVGVIWQHCPAIPLEAMAFTDTGASGVALFFVLSGFLITTLLLREESATGAINLRNFYVRRTLRIFPLYYAVLCLYTILVILLEHNAAGRLFIHNLPYYITYTNNWFVDLVVNEDGQRRVIFIFAWSLATEEQFYLMWPSVMKFFRRRTAIMILVATMVTDLSLTFAFGRADIPTSGLERLLRIATSPSTEICSGVLLALALDSKSSFAAAWRFLGKTWSAPLAAAIALVVVLWPGNVSTGWYVAQSAAFTMLIASCVIREDHGLSWLLRLPMLTRVGVVSYGMYLLHMLAVNAVRAILPRVGIDSPPLTFVLALLSAYILAEISYRVFESPILRLKARFRDGKPGEVGAPLTLASSVAVADQEHGR